MQIGAILGLIGDFLAFTGGLVLTLDAVSKEREFRRIKKITSVINSPSLARLKVDLSGVVITNQDDVETAFVRNSAQKAIRGAALLTIGFLLIIAGRILEYWK
jgi:hypothetical protein